jgi:hypothetical protein
MRLRCRFFRKYLTTFKGVTAVGYKFSLVLSREITETESAAMLEGISAGVVFGADSVPTNADITATRMDFDDTGSPSLAAAIESALEAVKKIPGLTVPGLTVPAQPAEAASDRTAAVATTDTASARANGGSHAVHAGNGVGLPDGDLVGAAAGSDSAQGK